MGFKYRHLPAHPRRHTSGVNSVALSSNGRYALSGSWDKTVKLWDVNTGTCLRTLEGHTLLCDIGGVLRRWPLRAFWLLGWYGEGVGAGLGAGDV